MPTRIGTSDRTILIVSAVAMAALTASSFAIAPSDSSPQVPGSSFSAEPSGTRAAYLVLQELGHDTRRSFEPITSTIADPPRTTLVLANPIELPSKGDRLALDSFVRRGGSVVAFGPSSASFLPLVGPTLQRRHEQAVETFPAALPGRLTRGTRELSAYRSPLPALDPAYIVVFGSNDNPAVVTARLGEGEVVWCLDETLIQNDGIARGTNVNLITNAAGRPGTRTIVWVEYYHGQRRSFWSYLAATPLVWGAAQLSLVALAVLAGASRRRGPMRSRPVGPRSSPLEFVDTMATLYERAGDAPAAVETMRQKLRRRLAISSGISPSISDEQLAAASAPRVGLDPTRTLAALAASADLLRRGIARREDAVAMVAELQRLAGAAIAAGRKQ